MFAHRTTRRTATAVALTALLSGVAASTATASAPTPPPSKPSHSPVCKPRSLAVGYSDALDKKTVKGAQVGGLSNIAYDQRSRSFVSSLDNHGTDPARLWFFKSLSNPRIVDTLVLRRANGTPYTGVDSDFEGLAVQRDGNWVISSENEPSIRIFGRNGVEKSSVPVPARFAVAPRGEATQNATLEGLTISPDGTRLTAAMEGTLSGDTPTDGSPASLRRMQVYRSTADGWKPSKQVGYRVDDGLRIAEVQEYAPGKLLVLEAAYDPAVGNVIKLYASTGLDRAPDVTRTANLSTRPKQVLRKTLVADLATCPSLGAPSKQPQANPLLDNYEGMIVMPGFGPVRRTTLISDDNFNPTQITRVLNLLTLLP